MRGNILGTSTKDEVDSYLARIYGHGLAKFELSYLNTCYLFKDPNVRARSYKLIPREKDRLSRLERRLIELIDDYLVEIEFYKFSKNYQTIALAGFTAWTTENKRDFIKKFFKLDPTLSLLDRLNRWLSKRIGDSVTFHAERIEKNIRITPLNLLILIWSNAFRRNSKISWKDMNSLLIWLSGHYKSPIIDKRFSNPLVGGVGENVLRLNWNKYRHSAYFKLAQDQYEAIFELQNEATLLSSIEKLRELINEGWYKSPKEASNARLALLWIIAFFPEKFGDLDNPLIEDISFDRTPNQS